MNYFNLKEEFLPSITGIKDFQILIPENYNRWSEDSFFEIGKYTNGDILNFESIAPEMEIKYKAKLLDLMIGIMFGDFVSGITISKQLLEFIHSFSLPENRTYPLKLFKIKKKQKEYIDKYVRFVLLETAYQYIDFSKSLFNFTEFNFNTSRYEVVETISFSSLEEFLDFQLNKVPPPVKRFFKISHVVFNENMSFDLFCLPRFNGYMVSEKLKNEIIKNGFTGIRFEEAPNITKEN